MNLNKVNSKSGRYLIGLWSLIATLLFFGSCKKDPQSIVIIKVQDTLGKAMPGLSVHLYGDTSRKGKFGNRIDFRANTLDNGEAKFDLTRFFVEGQDGFMFLDVSARKDTLYGVNNIIVKEKQTNFETVTIKYTP